MLLAHAKTGPGTEGWWAALEAATPAPWSSIGCQGAANLRLLEAGTADDQDWRAAYVSSIVELEATRAGARRPNVVARLIDLTTVDASTIDGVRRAAEQAVHESLKEAPELGGEGAAGPMSQGIRTRLVTNAAPRDPDAWLRERARK